MSQKVTQPREPRPALTLAQFDSPGDLLHAAEKVRDAGYKRFDCHSPFPIHGMDDAMGEKQSKLGWIVGGHALLGCLLAVAMQGWMSAVDYPLIISGKPFFSAQAFVPITFELTVLLSAFGTLFGMLALNGLPLWYHPIFNSKRFEKATDDGFFVSIEARDAKYNPADVEAFLSSIGGKNIETIVD